MRSNLRVLLKRSAGILCGGLAILAYAVSLNAQEREFVSNERLTLGTETRLSASVRAGDVDGDGDPDLVVANGRHWPEQNMLFLNQGKARFNVAHRLGDDLSTSYACELADLDGDKDLDLAVGNDNAPSVILTNDGSGHFQFHVEFGEPQSLRSLATADIDGDGDIDLLVTCRGSPNKIYFNDGQARFSTSKPFGTLQDSTIDVAIADLNEDGMPDLILANRDSQPNTIQINRGTEGFAPPVAIGNGKTSSRAVVTGDFNQDGHIDWAFGNIGLANSLYIGDGRGGYSSQFNFGNPETATYAMTVADIDKDGAMDIVAGNVGQTSSLFLNRDRGSRFEQQSFGEIANTYGLCASDLDGDGYLDIALANSGSPNRVYLNRPLRKKSP